jgi:hypothetical protein
MPIAHRNVRLDLMSSKEASEYLRRNDLAILPIGCFEMHGAKMPLATDSFIDWAMGILLAETWQCVCLPPIYYVYPGASAPWPGTVALTPEVSMAYVKAVALAAIRGGFKRLVLCASHGPMGFMAQSIIRSVHLESGQVIMHVNACANIDSALREELGFEGEDALVLGALHVLGLDGAFDPTVSVEKPMETPFPERRELGALGVSCPWTFNRDYQHVGLNPRLKPGDAARAARAMERVAKSLAAVPDLFSSYQEKMRKLYEEKPWDTPKVWTV